MSSQSLNATTYSGFVLTSNGSGGIAGSPAGFPIRDAQDYTLLKKRIGMYRALSTQAQVPLPSDRFDITQSNENNVSARFGQVGCDCSGHFPSNAGYVSD